MPDHNLKYYYNMKLEFIRANCFLSYTRQRNCQWDLQSHLSQSAENRICPGVRLRKTLIFRHIVSLILTEFRIFSTNQINLIVLMSFIIPWEM